MNALKTKINTLGSEFSERVVRYENLLKDFRARQGQVIDRDNASVRSHINKGRNLVRQRIDALVDSGSPFMELSIFAAYNKYENSFPYAGIVTGIGFIDGREVIIVANDATIKGGTYIAETIKKHLRAQAIAHQNKLPCIYLVDSGGVFLPEQSKVFADKDDFGRIFYNMAKLSADGIPQISVVFGSCTAGGAYIPAMSDETIIVQNQGTIFLGGPPLVKAATGEEVTAEELGGSEVHTSSSGVADHLAKDEEHALQICRNIVKTFSLPQKQPMQVKEPEDPLYRVEELYGLLPVTPRETVDTYEILARLTDGSKFQEFKSEYGKTIITGFAYIMGYLVGIVANNGILYSESALKATHFIELCNYRKIPLLFLQNISGFMVGKKYEHGGIARDGAKMVHAVATSNVPKFTIIFGGSYGAGNYAMAGRAYNSNLLLMYPNSRISVMGGEQAATVLTVIKNEQKAKEGKKLNKEEIERIQKPVLEKYDSESSAYFSSSQLWDDGIIDPADTRKILAIAIEAARNKPFPEPKNGIYRM